MDNVQITGVDLGGAGKYIVPWKKLGDRLCVQKKTVGEGGCST